jgi:hypothetical protein
MIRLTMVQDNGTLDHGDLLLDADLIFGVLEGDQKGVRVAIVYLRTGDKFLVHDADRDVQTRVAAARGEMIG